MNDIKNKISNVNAKLDRLNESLDSRIRTQELHRIMNSVSSVKTPSHKVNIVDALRKIANDINPSILR